jgi:Raf kinase inhibitor-like YbhB/YbcL family protein
MALTLTSRGFQHDGTIPERFSKDGGNTSPALAWTGVPEGTKSLALIVDDPDAPSGDFVHWLLYGIPLETNKLEEGVTAAPVLPNGARQGRNGFGELGWGGPQPPSGTHRYFFHLYALDHDPELAPGVSREELDEVIQGHILEDAELMGRYQHRKPATRHA